LVARLLIRISLAPSGVGYDIGCGNKAVQTNMTFAELNKKGLAHVMDKIYSEISFGMGRTNQDKIPDKHLEVIDKIADAEFKEQRGLVQLAENQLGTVGAGNHYVDLFTDAFDKIWVGVHFGSRGFGHKDCFWLSIHGPG
jgi:tRNA-splicing ligase RtcB